MPNTQAARASQSAPDRAFKHRPREIRPPGFYAAKLADLLVWDLRSAGRDVPGGQYYGRDYASVVAQGEAMVDYYRGMTLAARPIVHEAAAQAVNARLRELKLAGAVNAADLVDDRAAADEPPAAGGGEPEALYLNRLKSFAEARQKVDRDPIGSFAAIDRFLSGNPLYPDLRGATRVVGHLEQHPGLDFQRRVLLGGAFDMALAAAGPANA